MALTNHKCIKPSCGKTYQDEEIEAYYCPDCDAERKQVAKELDAKFNTVGQQPSTALSDYDAARGNGKFPSAGALGFEGFK